MADKLEEYSMKVSVLIPLYNAEKYISSTLESVLQQTYEDFEIVIVDDCGTDSSIRIAEEFGKKDSRIKIIYNDKNRGIAYSRNRGIESCKGEYIAILDNDDIMTPRRLELQVQYLENHQEIGAVGGNAQWIDENDKIVRNTISIVTDPLQIKMFLNFRNIFNNSEMTFRKSVVVENGLHYEDNCYGMEDYRFWIDFSNVSKISNLPQMVLKKRVISTNETSRVRSKNPEARKKKYLELQSYALRKSGFAVGKDMEEALERYMGETPLICSDYTELSGLVSMLGNLSEQAEKMELDTTAYMNSWFHSMIADQNDNVIRALNGKKYTNYWESKCNEMERYITELQEGKQWLETHSEEQERQIAELQSGKTWLEKHSEEQEKYITELQKGKEWLEAHAAEQEKYIKELISNHNG